MKKKECGRLSVFILVLSLFVFLPKLSVKADLTTPLVDSEITISMDFKDASLKDILKVFSIQSGLNFIASEAVQDRKVTLYLDKVNIDDVMMKLFKANNLEYELDKDSNIFVVKDMGKPQLETVTKVFYLKYASVSTSRLTNEVISNIGGTQASSSGGPAEGGGGGGTEQEKGTITQVLQKILTKNGTVTEDYRTNSLIVNDIPSRMPIVAQTIAAIDVPVSEVMLEVEMLDVSKNVVDKMGFKFGSTPFSVLITGAQATTGFPFHNWSKVFSADKTGTIDINNAASGSTYAMQLDFLRTLTDTKYLARPKILTLNNQTAEIKITTNETVGLAESTAGQTTGVVAYNAERVETGVTLRVTPQINLETNDITMFIMPTVKDVNTSSYPVKNLAGNYYKDPEERSTKSIVRVRDGETIILGGLLRNQKSTVVTKLPILGDLPVLGALFRHRAQDPGRERELLVFITPHIVKETSIELAKAKKVVLPMREQDTASGADREALISSSLNSFEKKKK